MRSKKYATLKYAALVTAGGIAFAIVIGQAVSPRKTWRLTTADGVETFSEQDMRETFFTREPWLDQVTATAILAMNVGERVTRDGEVVERIR